jgi:hypothetical protein
MGEPFLVISLSKIIEMKTVKYWLSVAAILASTLGQAQDAKIHLSDFRPRFKIDTFQVKGENISLRRRVIDALQIKGIKSAFWDDASNLLIVQYERNIIQLSSIKAFFVNSKSLSAF